MALIRVDFFSEVLDMSSQLTVILPQDTEGQIGIGTQDKKKKYPVLYLLHGMTDDQSTWERNTSIERYATERGLAVVMPCTNLGWYADMECGYRYYTYVAKEVPQVCRRFFPCISAERDDNFIAGNSMGGYGAFRIGLMNPDQFCAAASLSGGFDIIQSAKRNPTGYYPTLWEDILGDIDQAKGGESDLFAIAERAAQSEQKPRLYIWCGTEDFLYDQNCAMRDHLRNLGFDLTYRESPGDHSWKCWDVKIQDILDWFMQSGKEEI